LEELPAGCTPAFSRTWILDLTNFIDGYSSLFSASKTDMKVYRAARFSEFAAGAAINLSIIADANLRGLS